jgi:hypothetical protein
VNRAWVIVVVPLGIIVYHAIAGVVTGVRDGLRARKEVKP